MKRIVTTLALILAAVGCEPQARRIEPGSGPVSGALSVTRDDRRILVAAEDHDALLVIDRATRAIAARVPAGDGPSHVIELEDGRAAVTARYGNTISIVDVAHGSVDQVIRVGVEPMGLVALRNGNIAVALAGEAALAVVDLNKGQVVQRIALSDPDPRAVAQLPDGTLYVSHMATGAFSRVDLGLGTAHRVDVTTANPAGVRLVAEHLRSLTLDVASGSVLVAHSQANSDTVRAPVGTAHGGMELDMPENPDTGSLPPGDGGCGYSGCPMELGAVVPSVTEVDIDTDTPIVPTPAMPEEPMAQASVAMDCMDCGMGMLATPNPPSVLNPFEMRFAGIHLSNPTALALFDGGRGQLIVNMSSKNAVLLRRDLKGAPSDVLATVKLGHGAQSVALTHDGAFAYVWNQFDRSLSEIALPTVQPLNDVASKFLTDVVSPVATPLGAPEDGTLLGGAAKELTASTIALNLEDALEKDASMGRKMFHDATDTRIAAAGTVSCGSCHPDGRTDGRTWQFVFGPRNTPQLGGDILDTAPFHWPGDVPSVADLNTMTVLPFMGGTGLDPQSFESIAAFIGTLRSAPSAFTSEGVMTELEMRGEHIFYSEGTGCASCHAGAHFTDNASWDVGTQAHAADIMSFQTPVLHGLNRSGPYLHDGSQATLEDLVNNVVRTDRMGRGSHLTDDEAEALVAYLKTL